MATVKRDYYEVLGIAKNAEGDVIKSAYRKMAIKYHPDKNPDDPTAEDKFKEAAEAYEVLSNADKRARYDRFGHQGVGGASGGGAPNMEDIFSQSVESVKSAVYWKYSFTFSKKPFSFLPGWGVKLSESRSFSNSSRSWLLTFLGVHTLR
jgi:DnaJ-class molecular chaperone